MLPLKDQINRTWGPYKVKIVCSSKLDIVILIKQRGRYKRKFKLRSPHFSHSRNWIPKMVLNSFDIERLPSLCTKLHFRTDVIFQHRYIRIPIVFVIFMELEVPQFPTKLPLYYCPQTAKQLSSKNLQAGIHLSFFFQISSTQLDIGSWTKMQSNETFGQATLRPKGSSWHPIYNI